MGEPDARLALFVTDQLPSLDLRETLRLLGYRLEYAYSVDAAVHELESCVPELVVAGPLREGRGFDALLLRLHELGTRIVVVTNDESHRALATELGFVVRTAAQNGGLT
ncbi:MAG: hypothetical protein ABW352_24010 [Polyangiales bacterium]